MEQTRVMYDDSKKSLTARFISYQQTSGGRIESNATAKSLWADITPLARNEWICWVTSAKQEATRKRRIKVGIDKMRGGMRRSAVGPDARTAEACPGARFSTLTCDENLMPVSTAEYNPCAWRAWLNNTTVSLGLDNVFDRNPRLSPLLSRMVTMKTLRTSRDELGL